ncbi:hypothetical protein DV735_g5787, partial [Chaetothyriales sp. CBS 134920]
MGRGGYRQINEALNICVFEDYLFSQQANLPKLPDVEQISPRVLRVLGQNPGQFTLQGTNTYIVGTGSERLMIDTGQGIPEWADLIAHTLQKSSVSLSHVLLSHWHGDHTGGVPDLLRLYPHLSTKIYKNSPDRQQQSIAEGQTFMVEGATIRAVHAPGHSHDHMCFVLEEENAMFTGDNILGHGSSAVEELGIYMTTLGKMKAQGSMIGYPAHGVVIANLQTKITGELAAKIRREQQILRALGGNKRASLSLKELVTAVYGDKLGEALREKALEPLTDEVLRKLAGDGRVAFEMRQGEKRWFNQPPTTGAAPQKLRDSCYACVASKVRCDKVKPVCGRCMKRRTPCEYIATKRAGRKRDGRPREDPNAAPHSPQFDSHTNLAFSLDLSAGFETAAPRPLPDADFEGMFSSIVPLPGLASPNSGLTSPFDSGNFDIPSFFSNSFTITEDSIITHAQPPPLHAPLSPQACPPIISDDQIIQPPCTQSICCCIIRALTLLKTLVPDSWTTCDRSKGGLGNSTCQVPALERVLAENKRSIEEMMEMLECSCARDGYLLFVVAIIVLKLLGLYTRVARETRARGGDQSPPNCTSDSGQHYSHCYSGHSASSSSSAAAESHDGDDSQRRIALQQVLGELHLVQRLINTLSQHLEAYRSKQPEDVAIWVPDGQVPMWDLDAPFSALLMEQLEADLRKRLRALSDEIIEMLRKEWE